ncbi:MULTISPECIES: EAL domain-containing protein [unclassified Microbulbifer]|uniref:EAL domain-containing protein n=1 Tax=unclassified Microbulbifer TaxID=2619833 RepID=UPI001E5C4A14|nr:EAL domain-containing protein [Microbulbifer sp. YPW16]UHQ56354.1 EAL domain-containing protein [Microbulbifer sp. YPW16]
MLSAALIVFCKKALSADDGAAFLWLADAVAIAYLYRHPVRHWPVLFASFFTASFFAVLWLGLEWLSAVEYTLASLAEIAVAAVLLRKFCPRHDYFSGIRHWLRFVVVSAIVPPLSSASIGSYFVVLNTGAAFTEVFPLWYAADAMGILILLPVLLLYEDANGFRGNWAGWGHCTLVTIAVTALTLVLLEYKSYPFVFISLALVWAATVLNLLASLVVICVVTIAMAGHLTGISGWPKPAGPGVEIPQFGLVLATFAAVMPAYLVAVFTNIERRRSARAVEMESSFRDAVESSRIGVLVVSLEGRVRQVNRSFCDFLGYPEGEILGRSVLDFTHPEDMERSRDLLEKFSANSGQSLCLEKRYSHREGHPVWGELRASVARNIRGEALYILAQVEDIDWRKRSEQGLLEAKERLQVTLASITDAVISTDAQMRVNYMNPMAENLTGWLGRDAEGRPLDAVCHVEGDEDGPDLSTAVASCLGQSRVIFGSGDASLTSLSGHRYDITWSVSPLRRHEGDLLGTVLVIQDVSQQRELIRQLSYKASHDDLTGLPNRDAFKRALQEATREALEDNACHSLVYLDLDRFKLVNDSAGHIAGDDLLRQVSKCLRGHLQKADSVARLGGDEFGLLLRYCDRERARERCQALLGQIAALRFPWNNRVYDVGASAGITEINSRNHHPGDLLSQADVACFSAKRARRGSVMTYDLGKSAAADQHREIMMASVIRDAIDSGRFSLHMQPIAEAANTGRVSHYEFLLRMYDDSGQLLMPDSFVPAAERYGLMLAIDRWVVDETLVKNGGAIAAAGFSFALNISADALGDEGFQFYLLGVLERTPVPRGRISFEITETAIISHMDSASRFVTELRRLGCRIALDDFGNGLSSFGYLKSFTIDYIKIDGSFVRQVEENFVDLIIVESIHQIAQRLGARTVAEYVEDEATLRRMASLGVNLVQGYHVGHPRPLEEFLRDRLPGREGYTTETA